MAMELAQIAEQVAASVIAHKKTAELIPYARNARLHSEEQVNDIVASIKAFGFTSPILVAADNTIIAGHGRVLAAQKLGLELLPCIVLGHLTEVERQALVLIDNRMSEKSTWNKEMLALEVKELQLKQFDVKLLAFKPKELKGLLDPKLPDRTEDEQAVDALIGSANDPNFPCIAQEGDLWKLGNHRLLCGDSTKAEDYQRLMGGRLADLVLTDPPYNVAYQGGTKDKLKIANDDMPDAAFREFLFKFYKASIDVTKDGGAIYVYHADSEGYNFRGAMIDSGWLLKQCLIWVKDRFVMGRQDYHWGHEPILYGWKPGAGHNWYTDRKQTTILKFDRPHKNPDHPTPKPVEMLEYLIGNSSARDEIVLDPFLGSGSTLIAAEKTGRCCYGNELSPRYSTVIMKRWELLTGYKAELLERQS